MDSNLQIKETEPTPNRINPKKSIARHFIVKLPITEGKKKS